jgi:ribonucleoside-triphosphate reductase
VQTGSCNVITLNLNRITQDYFKKYSNPKYENLSEEDMEGFKAYLTEIVERVQKYHIAYKTNLYMFEKAGQLTASTAGYISMNKLYSTIGLNGINEAAMFLGIDVSYNDNYKNFCRFITGTISDLNKKNSTPSFQFNQEFVPAESLGSKNFLWDLKDGYWVPNDGRVLYNSYFYDAHDNTSVLDRMKMHGKEFTELLDGGVGCHLNLEDHLTKQQYLTLIDRAIEWGTSYFTFNIPNTQCDECGYISKHRLKECPKCGSKKLTWWTRVIGFLRPTKTFDKYRKIEENQRNYAKYETT